jgi:hypothetical protein
MNDFGLLIFIAVIGVAIGFAMGALFFNTRNERPSEENQHDRHAGMEEMAHVWWDKARKQLHVEVNGRTLQRAEDLKPIQKLRVQMALKELGSLDREVEKERDAVPELSESGVPAAAPAESERTSFNPLQFFTRSSSSESPEPPKSIAAQIDAILAEKIAGTKWEARGLRVMELPEKGVVVLVGLEQYDSVDSVPDEEIRSLLQDCVAEWERRATED